MKSANGIPFSYMLELFEKDVDINETNFWFEGEPCGDQHYLGCLPEVDPEKPYWAGYCDLPDGFACATAKELFNAPYYDGRSLRERWSEVHIYEIGLTPPEQFMEWHADDFPPDAYE